MTPETLEALKASIAKWEMNAVATDRWAYLIYPNDCALCSLFWYGRECQGCPVYEKTGYQNCGKTPYEKASEYAERWQDGDSRSRASALRWAKKEVAFLKSLLPPEEQVP